MAFTTRMPEFDWTAFGWSTVDYLTLHPLALGAVLATALIVIVELCFLIARSAAKRNLQKQNQADINAELQAAKAERKGLSAVVDISERRVGGRPQW